MIIVAGYIEIEPEGRETFLLSRQDNIARSRLEDGCIDYTFSADSSDPSRVRVFEVWESAQKLDVHLDNRPLGQKEEPAMTPRSRALYRYEVGSSGPLRS